MFSRSYHHHQDAQGAVPVPAAHRSGWVAHPDHYSRLESLLDSALATLALLHESHTAPTPLAFSSHMSKVLLALNKYIVVNQAVHPAPTPATTTTEPSAEATPPPPPSFYIGKEFSTPNAGPFTHIMRAFIVAFVFSGRFLPFIAGPQDVDAQ
ncbi:hypothetical protein DFH07DRAFT_1013543 [Mycena maculata]|uniref:Uncharacterized protein n=1 Tax=Mycena maculata TaxID=230809 RepID=A0AAD7JJQ1_9AGAR|nr:hypothetical protein DFH07DRAFT_1013543 [Mycena maculata]